ncbi:hypothetical protein SLEP1_g5300 [Rubroshorea leprosula]|uniref:Uncharacterized protein n=1 Tax=Rubroshorea leprosula TaxID=152421 RepID=A0AAV5I2A2_9ROSI|nr:hypothetical protein SLEP1_g5300 [Rubroshorea leprosula]
MKMMMRTMRTMTRMKMKLKVSSAIVKQADFLDCKCRQTLRFIFTGLGIDV